MTAPKITPSTPLYTRELSKGGRPIYKLHSSTANWDSEDRMQPGECRLVVCAGDGMRRYQYGVTPDTAGWAAAATLAKMAMEQAIRDRSAMRPMGAMHYTKKQQAVLEHCRQLLAECGAIMPTHWAGTYPHEIAQAAIDAARNWKP